MNEQRTTLQKNLIQIITWLPSLAIALFYIPNGLDKLLDPTQTGKIVESSVVMITAGIYILLGTALFLYNRTLMIGASMLVLYMTFVVLIHMYRGKPSEVVILILVATVFAAYIRRPRWFDRSGLD